MAGTAWFSGLCPPAGLSLSDGTGDGSDTPEEPCPGSDPDESLVLGAAFLGLVLALRGRAGRRPAALVFHYSLLYLALLFAAAAVDASL